MGQVVFVRIFSHTCAEFLMVSVPTIQANALQRVIEGITAAGVDPEELLSALDIDDKQIADPDARIPLRTYVNFFEEAAERIGDDCFGLRLGGNSDPTMFDVLGYAIMSSSTLEEALCTVCRYIRVRNDGASARLTVVGDNVRLSFQLTDTKVSPSRQLMEDIGALLFQMIRTITGTPWHPREVRFKHPAPADTREHEALFGCPVSFGTETNELVFDSETLERKLVTADKSLKKIMVRVIEKALSESAPDSFLETVERLVIDRLPHGNVSVTDVAKKLGMSGRTLQRRLAQRSMSYHQLIDRIRRRIALGHLNQHRLPLSEIAFLLGYTESSAFSRAFTHWTGITPGKYRQSHPA